jgi:FkbM family methyltransferase
MLRVGGFPMLENHYGDVKFHGLYYPHGDEITKHMADRLSREPFYQSDKLQDALNRVPKDHRSVAVDCGAWVGGWSRELAKHFEKVIAIEANPDNARCVSKNVPPNVTVINAAVGDRTGFANLIQNPFAGNVSSAIDTEKNDKARAVPMWRIDDMPEIRSLDVLDYLKIHVNGMELKAVMGAEDTIKRHKPVITLVLKPAISDYGDSAERARIFMQGLDYKPIGGERPYEIWITR